jgi:nicotinamidase-related amidase
VNKIEKETTLTSPLWNIWSDLLTDQDKEVIIQAGYEVQGATLWDSRALGNRPALLIVDMQEMFIGRDLPILEAISEGRTAMGSIAWEALNHLVPFVEKIRQLAIPVFYTRTIPSVVLDNDPATEIVQMLTPQPGDVVINKPYTSAFFATDLLTQIEKREVDTLIVVGNSTSGCVRAAVVDARQLGLHPIVPVECVFDRIEASHKVGLLDMWMKYATVQPADEVLDYVISVSGLENGHRS